MKYTGGLFWDVLLIADYDENWEDFFYSLIKVLPCKACREKTKLHHENYPIPKMKNNQEKNEYLWILRMQRGGQPWREKVNENGYTLESWVAQYADKPFTNNETDQ